MEQFAIMLLIGCPADLGACAELPSPYFAYETVQECRLELPAAAAAQDGSFPRHFSGCFAVDTELMDADAEIVWSIEDGALHASVEPVRDAVAVALADLSQSASRKTD